jgi:tetratricopeptide (TPR) repeat protein
MIRRIVVWLLPLVAALAAERLVHVRGEITGPHQLLVAGLTVDLLDLRNRRIDRAPVFANGSFEFQQVPPGEYNILVTSNGTVLLRTMVSAGDFAAVVNLQLPNQAAPRPASEFISLRRLRAKKAEQAGDPARAIDHLVKAASLDPDFFEAHTALGAKYAAASRYELAAQAFGRARELEPESAHAHSNLATALMGLGRHDEAVLTARAAVRIDPLTPKPRYVLGLALAAANPRNREAIEHLRTVAHLFPRARLAMASVFAAIGQNDAARAELGRYLESGPSEGRAQVEAWISSLR